jgi:pyridinium-3,5-bisthiocarboxylic acid mononucleotide nickel chelatase
MKIAYFDCFAGISGDMTLGALVDAGADFSALQRELGGLGLSDEFEITLDRVAKRGISAADVTVKPHRNHHDHDHGHSHSHGRGFTEIKQIIEQSGLSERVRRDSIAVFTKLGEAEAKIHGKGIEEIHFHEVGAVDAIVDIVGACICLELLRIEKVYCSPMPTFTGTVEIAHGTFPLPAPATVEILKGAPWRELGIEGEIVTPTGAAIVATLAEGFGPMPAMSVESIGYGAGKKDFGMPNVLRVFVGTSADSGSGEPSYNAEVAVIETNIDDLSPQVYEVVMERLFDAGALDVYLTPIQMKKNRPATLLSVICEPGLIDTLSAIIFEETTSIGIRIDTRRRMCLDREIVGVETEFGPIAVKVARYEGTVLNIQPEYEDCKAAAAKHGVAFKRVRDAAVVASHSKG